VGKRVEFDLAGKNKLKFPASFQRKQREPKKRERVRKERQTEIAKTITLQPPFHA
jgi:hypothetical protein